MRLALILATALIFAGCVRKAEDAPDGARPQAAAEQPADAASFETAATAPDEAASQAAPPGDRPPAIAPAPVWTLDPAKSRLTFTASQTGREFEGSFKSFAATIAFDPENLAGSSVDVTIDMTSAATGDKQRDTALPQADWFAAKQFPNARFAAHEIVSKGGGDYEARGDLAIRDKKRALVLPFSLTIDGATAHATGSASIIRTDFGVGQGEFSTDEWVGFDVTIAIDVVATRN